jgi:hypothetical protein
MVLPELSTREGPLQEAVLTMTACTLYESLQLTLVGLRRPGYRWNLEQKRPVEVPCDGYPIPAQRGTFITFMRRFLASITALGNISGPLFTTCTKP